MRVFIGVALPELMREALSGACELIREDGRGWADDKWVPRENLHMTLKFMGDLPDDAGPDLVSHLAGALRTSSPLTLPMKDPVWPLGGLKKATMLWSTFSDPEGACEALVSTIEDVAADFGVVPDSRVFNPHVTLVRTRHPRELHCKQEAVEFVQGLLGAEPSLSVPDVTVYSSRLGKSRPYYKVLGSARLGD